MIARADVRDLDIASTQYTVWNNILFGKKMIIDLSTGEQFSVCTDPLCDEYHANCEIATMNKIDCFVVDPNYNEGGPVLCASAYETVFENGIITKIPYFVRYHYSTRESEILLKDFKLNETPWSYDSQTQTIYFMTYRVMEDVSGDAELMFCSLNTRTKELRELCTLDEQIICTSICGDILYAVAQSTTLYFMDMREETPSFKALPYRNGYSVNGYFYYSEPQDTIRATVPEEIEQLCEKYGSAPYREYQSKNLYRIDLVTEGAKPELIAENAWSWGISSQYILLMTLSPQYRYSYINAYGNFYPPDATNVPMDSQVFHAFADYDGTARLLHADSLEEVAAFSSDRYFISALDMTTSQNGFFIYFSELTLEGFLGEKTSGKQNIFMGYLPFGSTVMTDEDIIPVQLN